MRCSSAMPRLVATPLHALLLVTRLLGQTLGRAVRGATPAADAIMELRLTCARLEQQNALLRARLARVPPRHRPHYAPDERWRVLDLRAVHGWSLDDAAAHALVTPATIARWEREALRAPSDAATPARPTPPVRRFADVVRHLIQTMDRGGVGGNTLIARTLARAGWRVSPETVRRIRRERPVRLPPAPDGTGVVARYPNHVWLMDLTTIRGLFGATSLTLALVFDACARLPLVWRVFTQTPTARDLARLLRRAVRAYGAAQHLITDRGRQFTAKAFRRAVRRLGIRQRFGAVGRVGSIALLERAWRTLKAVARVRARPPLTARSLEGRLRLALPWYAMCRPHSALHGATPHEVYHARTRVVSLQAPPRGRPGEGPRHAPYVVAFVDPNRTLPVLIRRAA